MRFPLVFDTFGPVAVARRAPDAGRLDLLRREAGARLPNAWAGALHARARAARAAARVWEKDAAEAGEWGRWLAEYAGARAADMSEADIRDRAALLAAAAASWHRVACPAGGNPWIEWERMCAWVARQGGKIEPTRKRRTLAQWVARVCCARWWRGQLRRHVAQAYERGEVALGRIGAGAGQWYVSDRAVKRRVQQQRAAAAMMRATVIESAGGQQMTLADAAARSVSNKSIRRGELMTRIRGCEEWADAQEWVGMFVTLTCPSKFHSRLKAGAVNPKYQGATPADAQAWLSKMWARLRAKWHRRGIRVVGFRVAEPHHDGCPHWHLLIWCAPEDRGEVEELMIDQWLSEDGDEAGAARFRACVKSMERGGASAYIAKYVAKNIDDHGVSGGHLDDEAPGYALGPDLLGDVQLTPALRVEAWAATWRIRQFQAIGQPPVTVWRELRRMDEAAAAGGSHALISAWLAAHRKGDRRADWHRYMRAQGGAALPRAVYPLCVHHVERERRGRYETVREAWACGVADRRRDLLPVVPTRRVEWGASGFSAGRRAAPWTRFNNCTGTGRAPMLDQARAVREALHLGADYSETGPPGRRAGPDSALDYDEPDKPAPPAPLPPWARRPVAWMR